MRGSKNFRLGENNRERVCEKERGRDGESEREMEIKCMKVRVR